MGRLKAGLSQRWALMSLQEAKSALDKSNVIVITIRVVTTSL